MTMFGRNLKLTIGRSHQAAFGVLFTEVFGCTVQAPAPNLRLYRLKDGFSIGVFFVDDSLALSEAQWLLAPWLEIQVPDLDAARREMHTRGIALVPYDDQNHTYHRIPGGPVFRLAMVARDARR